MIKSITPLSHSTNTLSSVLHCGNYGYVAAKLRQWYGCCVWFSIAVCWRCVAGLTVRNFKPCFFLSEHTKMNQQLCLLYYSLLKQLKLLNCFYLPIAKLTLCKPIDTQVVYSSYVSSLYIIITIHLSKFKKNRNLVMSEEEIVVIFFR